MKREILEVILSSAGIAAVCAALRGLCVFTDRTPDEVLDYLRKINWKELEHLFDPEEEENLLSLGPYCNQRRQQRARLDLASEFLTCMYHNNRLFHHWSNGERKARRRYHLQYDEETMAKILDLVKVTARFRSFAFRVRCKIIVFSLINFHKLRFLPIPSVAALRTSGDSDLLQLYRSVKQAATALASLYGDECVEEISATA